MPLLALVLLSALSTTPIELRDSIRDVYIDGALDRNAQTLTASSSRLIAVVCGEEVLLLDPEKLTVSRAPKSQFAFKDDRTTATVAELVTTPAGRLVRTDDATLLAHLDDRTLLVTAHQSKAGAMSIEELYETAPVWRAIADVYEPDAQLVERLRAIDAPVTLQVVMATWCGDSRQHVPRLLKSVALANNPNINIEVMGIGPEFLTPMDVITGENITNVPTVIVRRDGQELGRFVETPASSTIEEDVASIVAGTPKPHPGRYERGALVATGTYQLRDAKRRHAGTERFELYERPGGGVVAHSVIGKRDGTSIETWAAIDGEKKPRFVEVTHRGAKTTRTRFRRSGTTWSAHSRGADGGIVDQGVSAPEAFVAPATITYAWARGVTSAYVVPEKGVGEVGRVRAKVDEGMIPKYVKFEDGSERRLLR